MGMEREKMPYPKEHKEIKYNPAPIDIQGKKIEIPKSKI